MRCIILVSDASPYFHQQTRLPGEFWVPSTPHVVQKIKEQHPSQQGSVPAYMVTCQPQLFLPCPRLSCSNLTFCITSCSFMGRSLLSLVPKNLHHIITPACPFNIWWISARFLFGLMNKIGKSNACWICAPFQTQLQWRPPLPKLL